MIFELTDFTIIACDAQVTVSIATVTGENPTSKMVIERFIGLFGLTGLDNLLDASVELEEPLSIAISDEYGNSHSVEFDPFEPFLDIEKESDSQIGLLLRRIEVCLVAFLKIREKYQVES